MNSTFGIWLIGVGVAALALLLLFAPPSGEPAVSEAAALEEAAVAEAASTASTSYWRPATSGVTGTTASPAVVQTVAVPVSTATSCAACGPSSGVATAAVPTAGIVQVGGCGQPSAACALPACPSGPHAWRAPAAPAVVAPATGSKPLVGGCGTPSAACAPTPCVPWAYACYDVCADPCRVMRPGINRNMPPCVDECSFVQLHATVAHPICEAVRFQWNASRGWFLDPSASDPLYFAPATAFPGGEDVWITLLVTDASGAQYSDRLSLHVRHLP